MEKVKLFALMRVCSRRKLDIGQTQVMEVKPVQIGEGELVVTNQRMLAKDPAMLAGSLLPDALPLLLSEITSWEKKSSELVVRRGTITLMIRSRTKPLNALASILHELKGPAGHGAHDL